MIVAKLEKSIDGRLSEITLDQEGNWSASTQGDSRPRQSALIGMIADQVNAKYSPSDGGRVAYLANSVGAILDYRVVFLAPEQPMPPRAIH